METKLRLFFYFYDAASSPAKTLNYRGADKSIAQPGRKQATAIKLLTFASHSKKKFRRLSVQPGLRGSNDLRVGRKMANFQLFF